MGILIKFLLIIEGIIPYSNSILFWDILQKEHPKQFFVFFPIQQKDFEIYNSFIIIFFLKTKKPYQKLLDKVSFV